MKQTLLAFLMAGSVLFRLPALANSIDVGPESDEIIIQGWVRGFGSMGSTDSKGDFAAYDSTTWGAVVGVDKHFGNLLIGIAGGYASTDIGDSYDVDINTYFGSLYSTYGGERVYVDLALTYGQSTTKEALIGTSEYDSDLIGLYVGAGMPFEIREKVAIVPEVSLHSSYYEQDSSTAYGSWGSTTAAAADSSSFLGSAGFNASTVHHLDWLDRALAFLPELRFHWIHEFNADQNDFQYVVNGVGFLPFAVRSRDEDIARVGLGVEIWSWKRPNLRFELDYDALISKTYNEQILSGKMTAHF